MVNAIVGLSNVLNLVFCKRQRQSKQQYSNDTQGAIQKHSIINYTYRRKKHQHWHVNKWQILTFWITIFFRFWCNLVVTHGRFDSNTKILMHENNNLEIIFIIDVHILLMCNCWIITKFWCNIVIRMVHLIQNNKLWCTLSRFKVYKIFVLNWCAVALKPK